MTDHLQTIKICQKITHANSEIPTVSPAGGICPKTIEKNIRTNDIINRMGNNDNRLV